MKKHYVAVCSSTQARRRLVRCSYIKSGIEFDTNIDLDDDEMEYFEEQYGGVPVAKYFLASPGYYGYGGYGSDWCVTYYKLDNGMYVSTSPYFDSEVFDSENDMMEDIQRSRDAMLDGYHEE